MSHPTSQHVVRRLFHRLEALDVEGFLELFAADGRQLLPYAPEGFPDGFLGQAKLATAYRQLFRDYERVRFPSLHIEPMADPKRVFATYETDIRFRSGRRYGNRYAATFVVENDLVLEWVEYFDPITLQKQLGNPFAQGEDE